jgi:hypothetical protein
MTAVPAPAAAPVVGWGLWRIPERCPGCAAGALYSVFDGEEKNFLCRTCSRCWHLELGWIRQVSPLTCSGCEWRSTCSSRWDVAAASRIHGATSPIR